jgi:hypothetical protein
VVADLAVAVAGPGPSHVMLGGLSMQNEAMATMTKYWREAAAVTSVVRQSALALVATSLTVWRRERAWFWVIGFHQARAGDVSNLPHANAYAQQEQEHFLQIQQQQQQQQQQQEDLQIDDGCGLLFRGTGESAARVVGFWRHGLRAVGRGRQACRSWAQGVS